MATHSRGLRRPLYQTLAASIFLCSTAAVADFPSSYTLPSDQWRQIVIPGVLPATESSVESVFTPELSESTYGTEWALFEFDSAEHRYRRLLTSDSLNVGRAYWLIQLTGTTVDIELPEDTRLPGAQDGSQTIDNVVYRRIPIAAANAAGNTRGWSMIGKPGLMPARAADLRVTASGAQRCTESEPCTLQAGFEADLTSNRLFSWNAGTGEYDTAEGSSALGDWQGYWIASLNVDANTPPRNALLPVATTEPSMFDDDFNGNSLDDWSIRHQVEGSDAQYTTLDIDQTTAGALTLIPTRTPGWFANGDAPLVFKSVNGNFSVETRVSAESESRPGTPPGADFNSAGLMARNAAGASGPENYIMVNVGRQNSSISNGVGSETKTTVNSRSTLDLASGSNAGRLILCRVGSRFQAYRFLDNETGWTRIGDFTRNDLPATLQVGMIANGFNGPDLVATFDYIRLNVPQSASDCLP